jgi:hypothetical protein
MNNYLTVTSYYSRIFSFIITYLSNITKVRILLITTHPEFLILRSTVEKFNLSILTFRAFFRQRVEFSKSIYGWQSASHLVYRLSKIYLPPPVPTPPPSNQRSRLIRFHFLQIFPRRYWAITTLIHDLIEIND